MTGRFCQNHSDSYFVIIKH